MTVDVVRVSRDWLDQREAADAAARSRKLVDELRRHEPADRYWLIHDLGSGSGSMGRWLAPLLSGPQCWVLHDRDPELLSHAAVDVPAPAADGSEVTVETVLSDITQLDPEDLAGATLVVASALLDLLTPEELERLIRACAGVGCPVLFALSVTGRVQLLPPDPLDGRISLAFNAHQRRLTRRGPLLGSGAVEATVQGFHRLGAEVIVHPTPWRLGGPESELLAAWFNGWVEAAGEQEPALMSEVVPYRRRRLREAAAGALAVTVGHADLLVLP